MSAARRRAITAAAVLLAVGTATACGSDDVDAGPGTSPTRETETAPPADAEQTLSVATPGTAPPVAASTERSPTTTADVPPPTTSLTDADPPAIGWRTVEVIDPTRPTDEVTRDGVVVLDGSPDRTIPVELVYPADGDGGQDSSPADGEPRPLVIWINGLGGEAAPGDPLLLALHDAGYIVAAPNSPEVSAPAGQDPDVPELPADISRVIDALLDPADGVADDLQPTIDASRIGVAGHSVGANASLALAFHDCCRDDRIDAVVAYGSARLETHGFSELTIEEAPLLLITGSADTIAPTLESQAVFDRGTSDTYLLEIDEADHFQPIYDGAGTAVGATSINALVTFLDVHLSGDGDAGDLTRFATEVENATWQAV